MNIETISTAKNMMSDSKFFMGYSRFDENLGRYENWDESVEKDENPSIAITSNSCLCKDCLINK